MNRHGYHPEPIRANLHDPHAPVRCSPHRQRQYDKAGNLVDLDRARDIWFVKTPAAILKFRQEKRREAAR